MFKSLKILLFCLSAATFAPSVGAAQVTTNISEIVSVALIPGWKTERGTHMAGIQISLANGWKTYWRAPGDAGIPPQFDWSGSKNLAGVELHWPKPKVFDLNGMRTIAYDNVTIIPVELTPTDAGDELISLNAKMEFGVCEEICIPASVALVAELKAGASPVTSITQSLANRPISARMAGVGAVTCAIAPIPDGLRVVARIRIPDLGGDEITVVEVKDQSVWIAEATTIREGNTLIATTELVPPDGKPFLLSRSDIRFTVFGNRNVVDINGCTAG